MLFVLCPPEGASEASSDLEKRIRVLTEELKRRQREADQLKRQQKRNNKAKLREKEETLRKQIKEYDDVINQQRLELQDTEPKPLIKQPSASSQEKTSATSKESGDGTNLATVTYTY